MGVTRDFEIAYNRYLDEEFATYQEAQAMVAHFQTIRVLNEKTKRDAANSEIERQANAEQERSEVEQSAHIDSLRQQLRDARG
jgi:hypothetical protein